MPRLAEKTAQYYGVRREVSQPADLAMLFLARMLYDVPPKTPRPVLDLVRQLKGEPDARPLERVNQQRGGDVFKGWLRRYLMINETIKGTSFYSLHPALAMAGNGEGVRVELFIAALARSFTLVERDELIETLWADERLPPFELMLRDLIRHQLTDEQVAPPAAADRFEGCNGSASPLSVEGILTYQGRSAHPLTCRRRCSSIRRPRRTPASLRFVPLFPGACRSGP